MVFQNGMAQCGTVIRNPLGLATGNVKGGALTFSYSSECGIAPILVLTVQKSYRYQRTARLVCSQASAQKVVEDCGRLVFRKSLLAFLSSKFAICQENICTNKQTNEQTLRASICPLAVFNSSPRTPDKMYVASSSGPLCMCILQFGSIELPGIRLRNIIGTLLLLHNAKFLTGDWVVFKPPYE